MVLTIDRDARKVALHRQIYHVLRAAILEGRLLPGTRLPGTRVLAADLGVSRTTVLTAYAQLAAEGYVVGRDGGGTCVADDVPQRMSLLVAACGGATKLNTPVGLSVLASRMIAEYGDVSPRPVPSVRTPFTLGLPALDVFPVATWARLVARRWRKHGPALIAPDDGPGYLPLREAIAEYVVAARAVRCTADQIVITAGTQQAISLLAHLLLNPADMVWVEEHGYKPARAAFVGVGARLIDVPVDEQGFDVAYARNVAPSARLALVTPSCEAPLGVTMSLRRRLDLLTWAHQEQSWIIEDDYNGELRYEGRPLAAVQGMEHAGAQRVLYVRTFSKTVFPALRLGYVVLPPELVEPFTRARLLSDRHSPTVDQAVLADFISEGHFAAHVRRMRDVHIARQRSFIQWAAHELGDLLRVQPAPAGLRLVGWLPRGISAVRVAEEARRRHVIVEPLSDANRGAPEEEALILGYVAFRVPETRRALSRLADAIRSVQRGG